MWNPWRFLSDPDHDRAATGDRNRRSHPDSDSEGRSGTDTHANPDFHRAQRRGRGAHYIRARIGAGLPADAVLVSRRPTGEIYSPSLRTAFPNRDWILTRILWLCGLEPGKNRLGKVDTMRRYIYIHGCPDEDPMGVPGSRGCVKMRNREIIELFDRVAPGTRVFIRG
jgi:L,D-transpeptidase YbiS